MQAKKTAICPSERYPAKTDLCPECGEVGPFYAGTWSCCAACHRERAKANRLKNIDRVRAYDRGRGYRRNNPETVRKWREANKAKINEKQRAYRRGNPEKYRARTAVGNALRDGKLTKPDRCQRCGEARPVEGHHHDYSKPVEVEWICRLCHGKEHRRYDT